MFVADSSIDNLLVQKSCICWPWHGYVLIIVLLQEIVSEIIPLCLLEVLFKLLTSSKRYVTSSLQLLIYSCLVVVVA